VNIINVSYAVCLTYMIFNEMKFDMDEIEQHRSDGKIKSYIKSIADLNLSVFDH